MSYRVGSTEVTAKIDRSPRDLEEDYAKSDPTPKRGAPATRTNGIKASPCPFGWYAYGMTACLLGFINTGWVTADLNPMLYSYAFFFAGLGQLLPGQFELIRGNMLPGTAFSCLGIFWIGHAVWNYWANTSPVTLENNMPYAVTGQSLWFAWWGVLVFIFFFCSLRRCATVQSCFLTMSISFFVAIGANYNKGALKALGYINVLSGLCGIYCATGELVQVECGLALPGTTGPVWF